MEHETTCIIIDDNVIDILIHKMVLKARLNKPTIIDFVCAKKGLEYIKENYPKKSGTPTILLLDLNMPNMNGWEFLEQFEKMDRKIKSQIKIFVVSFYIDSKSKEIPDLNRNVTLFVPKPLNREKISEILDLYQIN